MSAPKRLGPFQDWTQAAAFALFALIGSYFGYHWLIWLFGFKPPRLPL